MTTSPEEQADLDKLHADQAKECEDFSSSIRMYLEMDETMLKHSGHKTNEAAVFYAAKQHIKRMDNLVKQHLKKWPD